MVVLTKKSNVLMIMLTKKSNAQGCSVDLFQSMTLIVLETNDKSENCISASFFFL